MLLPGAPNGSGARREGSGQSVKNMTARLPMTNRTLTLLALSLALASTAFGTLTGEQLLTFKQKLANSDAAIRKQGLEELLKENPKTAGNDILPFLCSALADHDAQVRVRSAAVLAIISFSTHPKFNQVGANMTDLRSYPRVEPALIVALNDPDEETRKNALAAYALTFDVPPAVQNMLASRYDGERPNSVFRNAILEALTIDGTATPSAKALLIRVADTPTNDSLILAQVIQDSKAAPLELLPRFGARFMAAHDEQEKALFARAIAKFGASAKPYIPELEGAASSASNDSARQAITRAAQKIQASN
jgi:hypothetical protein